MKKHGPLTIGDGEVTLQAIADHCGVALSTVSLALRGRPNVKEQTRQHIVEVAKAMGYDPAQHDMARRLALKKHGTTPLNRTIAVLFPYTHLRGYFGEIYLGILEKAKEEKFDVLTVYHDSDVKRSQSQNMFSPLFRRGDIDGVIICRAGNNELITMLREMPGFGTRPICSVFGNCPGIVSLRSNEVQGTYEATRHLLSLGHHDICFFVTGYENFYHTDPASITRMTGAERAFAEYGLDPSTGIHIYSVPSHWLNPIYAVNNLSESKMFVEDMQASRASFQEYMRAHPEITAYVGWNDACALNIWYACTDAGKSVPDDISIVGFDDTDSMLGPIGEKLLTSVHVPLYEIGQSATERLFQMILNKETSDENLTFPTNLAIRASTAPPPSVPR